MMETSRWHSREAGKRHKILRQFDGIFAKTHSRPRPHLSHSWESGNLSLMMSIIPNSRVAADPLDNRIMDITNKVYENSLLLRRNLVHNSAALNGANRICSAVEAIAKLKHESVGGLMHTVVNLLRGAENLLLDYIRVKHGTSLYLECGTYCWRRIYTVVLGYGTTILGLNLCTDTIIINRLIVSQTTKRDPMPIMLKSLAHSLHRIGLLNCVYRNNMVCYFGGGNFPANWGHTSASSLPP
ncbi:hypothetical protein DINM_005942 [Dirofilaria immitis]|nr:hypothetical protein [Dirofilaria immitis]